MICLDEFNCPEQGNPVLQGIDSGTFPHSNDIGQGPEAPLIQPVTFDNPPGVGELLVIHFMTHGTGDVSIDSGDWILHYDEQLEPGRGRFFMWSKFSDGTESTVNITLPVAAGSSWISYRYIDAIVGTISPVSIADTTNPDPPPPFNPPFWSTVCYQVAACGWIEDEDVLQYPNGFIDDNTKTRSGVTEFTGVASVHALINQAVDPDPYAMTASVPSIALSYEVNYYMPCEPDPLLWVEVPPGDWTITNEQLVNLKPGFLLNKCRQGSSPRVIDGVRNPDYTIQLFVTLVGVPWVGTWKVIIDFRDFDNYRYVSFEVENGQLWPRMFIVTPSLETEVMPRADYPLGLPFTADPPQGIMDVVICYAKEEWSVYSIPDGEEIMWTTCDNDPPEKLPDPITVNGVEHEIGMTGFLEGRFDNFRLFYHWESKESCSFCSCFCIEPTDQDKFKCYPETLTATIVPVHNTSSTYSCPDIDNITKTLRQGLYNGTDWDMSPRKFLWQSDGAFSAGTPSDIEIQFLCEGGSTPLLYFAQPNAGAANWGDVIDGQFIAVDWSLSTCEPLNLVFGDISMTGEAECDPAIFGSNPGFIRGNICPNGQCIEDTPANRQILADLRWKIVITA